MRVHGDARLIRGMNRVTDIEQQLAHLRWRRMQNERQIRGALEVTKSLQLRDKIMHVSVDAASEKSEWMTSVVRDELSRPLVITDEEIHKMQSDEAKAKKMLGKYAQVKLDTVNKLKKELKHQQEYVSSVSALRENREKQKGISAIEKKIKTTIQEVEKRQDIVSVVQVPKKIFS